MQLMEPASSMKAETNAMRQPAPGLSIALMLSVVFIGIHLPAAELDRASMRAAIEKAIPLMQASAEFSLDQRRCFTCHHVAHTSIAASAAWRRGFEIDEKNLRQQLRRTRSELTSDVRRFLDGRFSTGQADMLGSSLWFLKELGWTADSVTADTIRFLVAHDKESSGWEPAAHRPPTVGSKFTTTFLVLQAIQHYGPSEPDYDIRKRRRKAVEWLENTTSFDNEDAVHRLRALHLTESADWKKEGAKLLAAQRKDGGWAQLPQLNSDAYATGTALSALVDTGFIKTDSSAYQLGIQFLLGKQKSDGSWHVNSRTNPTRPFYHSLFPHEHDQFISVSATAWSTYALLQAFPISKQRQQPYLKLHPVEEKLASSR